MVRRVSSQVGNVRLRRVDIGGGRNVDQARRYGIRATPTTVILRANGAVATKLQGAVPAGQLEAALQRAQG